MVIQGLEALLSVVALAVRVQVANGEFYRTISAAVLGGNLVLLCSRSAACHAISAHRLKVFFRSLDHVCIRLLIAGSCGRHPHQQMSATLKTAQEWCDGSVGSGVESRRRFAGGGQLVDASGRSQHH